MTVHNYFTDRSQATRFNLADVPERFPEDDDVEPDEANDEDDDFDDDDDADEGEAEEEELENE